MKMLRSAVLAATIVGLGSAPALALSCYGAGSRPSVSFGIEFRFGDITEQDEANFDLMRLRRVGVDATSVEYWNGCIRAWVRSDNGVGEHMEFYHPRTLERVVE
jgi:hypothetical protein